MCKENGIDTCIKIGKLVEFTKLFGSHENSPFGDKYVLKIYTGDVDTCLIEDSLKEVCERGLRSYNVDIDKTYSSEVLTRYEVTLANGDTMSVIFPGKRIDSPRFIMTTVYASSDPD